MIGPFKMALNNNDLNSLCFSSTKATIAHCILELGFTIYLDSFGIFGGKSHNLCTGRLWSFSVFPVQILEAPPPYYLVSFFFSWALSFHIPQL